MGRKTPDIFLTRGKRAICSDCHNPERPAWQQQLYDKKSNDELFELCFNRQVNWLIDDYSTNAEQRMKYKVSRDRLICFVLDRYPFVKINAEEESEKDGNR